MYTLKIQMYGFSEWLTVASSNTLSDLEDYIEEMSEKKSVTAISISVGK